MKNLVFLIAIAFILGACSVNNVESNKHAIYETKTKLINAELLLR